MIDILCNIVLVFFALPGLVLEWILGSLGSTEFAPDLW